MKTLTASEIANKLEVTGTKQFPIAPTSVYFGFSDRIIKGIVITETEKGKTSLDMIYDFRMPNGTIEDRIESYRYITAKDKKKIINAIFN